MKILNAVQAAPGETGTLALCYAVLMLEQSELPPFGKREAHFDYLCRGLNADAISLGRRIIEEIEEKERVDLDHLEQPKRDDYTRLFSRTLREMHLLSKPRLPAGLRPPSTRLECNLH